jgi:putative SOS response-associated peptidase YedK
MPAILGESAFARWLAPSVTDPSEVQAMLGGAQTDLIHHSVTTRLNAAKTDEPEFANPA